MDSQQTGLPYHDHLSSHDCIIQLKKTQNGSFILHERRDTYKVIRYSLFHLMSLQKEYQHLSHVFVPMQSLNFVDCVEP